MKDRLKEKLEKDDYCLIQLQKMTEKECSYDQLWDDKLCSSVSSIAFFIILTNEYTNLVNNAAACYKTFKKRLLYQTS